MALPDLDVGAAALQPGAGDGRQQPHRLRGDGRHRRSSSSLKHAPGTRDPFAERHPWYVLMETSGLKADGAAERVLTEALEAATERGLVADAAIAGSLTQARDFWRLRESYSEAQKPRRRQHQERRIRARRQDPRIHRPRRRGGGAPVPRRAAAAARPFRRRQHPLQHRPAARHGARLRSWRCGTRWRTPCTSIVLDLGGSISAEHGIGQMKRAELARVKGAVAHGPDAPHQGGARPQGHPQSGQGALASSRQSLPGIHPSTCSGVR